MLSTQVKHVILFGPVPPPIGGNTVHVERLLTGLSSIGILTTVLDYSCSDADSKNQFGAVIALSYSLRRNIELLLDRWPRSAPNQTIVHFHLSALRRFQFVAPILLLLLHQYTKVVTIHSGSFGSQFLGPYSRVFLSYVAHNCDHIITVNTEQRDFLVANGVPSYRISVIPAYLQQPQSDIPSKLEEAVTNSYKTIVLTSGSITKIYNFDVLLQAMAVLPSQQYHFVFAFYGYRDPEYSDQLSFKLSAFNNISIFYDLSPAEFLSVMHDSHIYVRSTMRDGDAVSIREAINLGKTVFATDSTPRPDECYLFSATSPDSLVALFQRLDSSVVPETYLGKERQSSNLDSIVEAYSLAINHRNA